ncbi:MAG: transposase [Deltaproteobacteria bacterium]|jgi:hypothetical protein|nr:transposase [Deltaproteobacteria bacterium]
MSDLKDDYLSHFDKIPPHWPPSKVKDYENSFERLMVLEIAPKINPAPLMAKYKGKGIISGSTRNIVLMCLLMVYQLTFKLTDQGTREALESSIFLQTALGLEPNSDETIVEVRAIRDFRDRFVVKRDLFDAVFGAVLDGFKA